MFYTKYGYNVDERMGYKMTLKEQTEIFSKNLNKYLQEKKLTQKEVAEAIGVSQQSLNFWVQGRNLPRMDKVQLLAEFFGVRYTDLISDTPSEDLLQEAFDRPDMRTLFSLAKDCTPDQIDATIKLLEQFKNLNKGE